jgi:hypothetical protein
LKPGDPVGDPLPTTISGMGTLISWQDRPASSGLFAFGGTGASINGYQYLLSLANGGGGVLATFEPLTVVTSDAIPPATGAPVNDTLTPVIISNSDNTQIVVSELALTELPAI